MANDKYLELILGSKYYSLDDLRYNQKVGVLFSKEELNEFLETKEEFVDKDDKVVKRLPLKTFNSKHCYFINNSYLLRKSIDYLTAFVEDVRENSATLLERNADDIMISRLFSEVEGTLNIENVPTTHKRIKEVFEKEKVTEKNDIIIKNMQKAIEFIAKYRPAFNKENLYKLYTILSKDCLSEENELKNGYYYRDDSVWVGAFDGAPADKIEELMDSLFDFVNDKKNAKVYGKYFPHICHYYILYVHPYFDYNGRTARMVSFWITYLYNLTFVPLYISEAINESKKDYYKALTNTRLNGNDLTYFLGYVLDSAIKFNYVYKNLEEIKKSLSKTGDFLTSTELTYLKKILVHNSEDYFNYKMFFKYINATMSKQAGLKILNHLSDYGILIKETNKKKESIYKLNQNFITYKLSNK